MPPRNNSLEIRIVLQNCRGTLLYDHSATALDTSTFRADVKAVIRRPNGQSCLEKETRDVNDGLFGQMWISHSKGIKYSLIHHPIIRENPLNIRVL